MEIDHLRDIVNPLCVDYRASATRTEMAEAALRATSEPFALAGMSLGGWVAQEVVIHGRQDATFSLAEHEAIAGAIPQAKLAVIEECGHESPLEQPHAVTTLLRDWLQNE